jgi:NTP pyrophosphatase (non-canonical NTP hydrolase)
MKLIAQIDIQFYRSIKDSKIKGINELNIFSGKNDVGKSNILKALDLFFNKSETNFLEDFNKERLLAVRQESVKGKQFIKIQITFKNSGNYSTLPDSFIVTKSWDRAGNLIGIPKDNFDTLVKRNKFSPRSIDISRRTLTGFLNKIRYTYVPAIRDESVCKNILGTDRTVDHDALNGEYEKNKDKRPKTLDEWQKMFQEIYPRTTYDQPGRSTLGLFEEIGEFAEAIRVFDRHPKYFAGEAADVFSYIMGIANEFVVRETTRSTDFKFSLEKEFMFRYPGLCKHCGFQICVCPTIPEATVGRMSKELAVDDFQKLFSLVPKKMEKKAEEISASILSKAGGVEGILSKFPFDRGETNSCLIQLCLTLADLTISTNPEASKTFRSIALTASSSQSLPGSSLSSSKIEEAIDKLKEILPEFINEIKNLPDIQKPVMTSVIGELMKKHG